MEYTTFFSVVFVDVHVNCIFLWVTDDIVMVVNAGGNMIKGQGHQINFQGDSFFEGGDVLTSDEKIFEGGDYSCLYQSVRYGNFCYTFNNLDPGDYFLDLHFAEIVYTNGPKGIRVFDVFLQEEKARTKDATSILFHASVLLTILLFHRNEVIILCGCRYCLEWTSFPSLELIIHCNWLMSECLLQKMKMLLLASKELVGHLWFVGSALEKQQL